MTDADRQSHLHTQLASEASRILGDNLVGIYLHGSLALGGFCWKTSDFDYLIVVWHPLTAKQKRELLDSTLEMEKFAPPRGLEMSVVLFSDCRSVVHPSPFLLHYSHAHRSWYERAPDEYIDRMNGFDPDLAGYFAVVRQAGIVLDGMKIEEVFEEVPPEFVLDSFRLNAEDTDLPDVLNFCRYKAYRQSGVLLSKVAGGEWGLAHLPAKDHAGILAALKPYIRLCTILPAELTVDLFHGFHRRQVVTKCWRKENGEWRLKEIPFIDDWSSAHFILLVKCLRHTLETGGAVVGAFAGERLTGFVSLENVFFGKSCRYLQLSSLHVSAEYRKCGIGKMLFRRVCAEARTRSADKLYISAHSAQETQAFYRSVGCVEAMEYNPRLVEEEPCDCQLEFDLAAR